MRQPVPEIIDIRWLSRRFIGAEGIKPPLSFTRLEGVYLVWGTDQDGRKVCVCTFRMTGGTKTTRAQAVENMKQLANVRYAQGE